MKAFNDLNLQELHWVERIGWRLSQQELCNADDEVIATMRKIKGHKGAYEVDAPGNRWLFVPKGFFNRHIEIYSLGTGDLFTIFRYKTIGEGRVTLPDGPMFEWKQISYRHDKWAWLEGDTDNENPVIAFDTSGFFRARADLTFDEDVDFPALLVFLGWYLHTVLRLQRASAG